MLNQLQETFYLEQQESFEFPDFQAIEVGPVKIDTGNDWQDFGFAFVFFIFGMIGLYIIKRIR